MEILTFDRNKLMALVITITLHLFLFALLAIVILYQPLKEKSTDFFLVVDNSGISGSVLEASDPIFKKFLSSEKVITSSDLSPVVVSNISQDDKLNRALSKLKILGKDNNVVGDNKYSTGSESMELSEKELSSESLSLGSRKLIHAPDRIQAVDSEGTVIVEIVVDEMGNVIRAIPGIRGSTTNDKVLYEKARKAALMVKFEPSEQGIKEQRGTYTFVFTLE
jgi:TonB family protein